MADFDPRSVIQGMFSGIADAQSRKYHKAVGKSGAVWLYADQPNAGDNVYSHTPNPNWRTMRASFAGFGGAVLKFPLVDGTVYEARAPWHSNAVAMFTDTGIDLRQTHLTLVVIGKGVRRVSGSLHGIITDVLYKDLKPLVGYFKRGDYLADKLANELDTEVFLFVSSQGGSSAGFRQPGKTVDESNRW